MSTYTVAAVAQVLGITRQRVHQIIRQLGLRPRRFGPLTILTSADLVKIQTRDRTPGRKPSPRKRKNSHI